MVNGIKLSICVAVSNKIFVNKTRGSNHPEHPVIRPYIELDGDVEFISSPEFAGTKPVRLWNVYSKHLIHPFPVDRAR